MTHEEIEECVENIGFAPPVSTQRIWISNKSELEIIEAFYKRVCERAESNMLKTGKLEGAHFAAMQVEIKTLRQAVEPITAPDRLRGG